jgi:FkbM family methyltransferase
MGFYTADGLGFHVRNDADIRIVDEIVLQKSYEKPRLGFRVQPGEFWLDLGANIGAFSVWASQKRQAHVLAVEPVPDNVRLLNNNVRINKANVQIIEGAIGSTNGVIEMRYNENTPARSSSLSKKGNLHLVNKYSIVEMIEEHKPDGIKMDIEGGEFDILDVGFPLDSIRAVALEYHFRFDKNCHSARRRVSALAKHFKYHSVSNQVYALDNWLAWQDTTMFFWN